MSQNYRTYNESEWARVEQKYMFDGVLAKFAQYPDLKAIMKATGTKKLEEISGDKKWATGLPKFHPNAFDTSYWTGKNQLGQCLMLVCDRVG